MRCRDFRIPPGGKAYPQSLPDLWQTITIRIGKRIASSPEYRCGEIPGKQLTWISGGYPERRLHENSILCAGQVPVVMYSWRIQLFPNSYPFHGLTPAVIRHSAAGLKPDSGSDQTYPAFFRIPEIFPDLRRKITERPPDYKPYTAICNGTL
jgi:hypothetical protein